MVAVSINFGTFDYTFFDKGFCVEQLKEWNRNLKYYTKKSEKVKKEDLKGTISKEIEKSKKQLQIYNILIEYIYNKKENQRTILDQENALVKIKDILNLQ
jgi:hypothetical protein